MVGMRGQRMDVGSCSNEGCCFGKGREEAVAIYVLMVGANAAMTNTPAGVPKPRLHAPQPLRRV
jgi:hypothetical protein